VFQCARCRRDDIIGPAGATFVWHRCEAMVETEWDRMVRFRRQQADWQVYED
jgi:hypothetical protein